MALQVGEMSPGKVNGLTGRSDVSRWAEMALQVGEMSPCEVRWPYR